MKLRVLFINYCFSRCDCCYTTQMNKELKSLDRVNSFTTFYLLLSIKMKFHRSFDICWSINCVSPSKSEKTAVSIIHYPHIFVMLLYLNMVH